MDVVMGGIAMVTRYRPALGAGLVTLLTLGVAAPVLGATERVDPDPLRSASTLRVADIAAAGNAVAIGWREGPDPGNLRVTLSTNGGRSYEREPGSVRMFVVAGIGRIGMGIDICADSIWAASAATIGDEHHVLLRRRALDGRNGQGDLTPLGVGRVRAVDVACVGHRLLAVAWIEQDGDSTRARLRLISPSLIRLSGPAGTSARIAPTATNSLQNLGDAGARDGISVVSTGSSVFVAWSSGARRNLQLKRFDIGSGGDPTIQPRATERLGFRDAVKPELTARGEKVVLAYSDDGKLKVRISENLGGSFSAAETLLNQGTVKVPSYPTSATMSGSRIVIQALKKLPNDAARTYAPVRIQTSNLGDSWGQSPELGNRGIRVAVLRKVNNAVSRLNEAWHDDGPSGDVIRAQREVAN
jgi:hypothetical protein